MRHRFTPRQAFGARARDDDGGAGGPALLPADDIDPGGDTGGDTGGNTGEDTGGKRAPWDQPGGSWDLDAGGRTTTRRAARRVGAGRHGPATARWVVSLRAVVVVLAMLAAAMGMLWLQSATLDVASAQIGPNGPAVPVPPVGATGPPSRSARPGGHGSSPPAPTAVRPADLLSPGSVRSGTVPPVGGKLPADGDDSPAGASVLVHVVGRVTSPGVVRLAAGSRALDAVRAAGGTLPDAALEAVNLAAPVQDGQQIMVPSREEVAAGSVPPVAGAGAGGTAVAEPGAVSRPGGAAPVDAKVNINTATADELATLPRVGPVLAERIVQWRTEHGAFSSIDQLDAVSGIGGKMLEALRDRVTV